MQLYGYANRKCGPANGTHDPLFAKVLVLEAGDSRMAIVTMDLGAIVSEKLRDDVASRLNIRVLLLSVSHDHSAPSFLPYPMIRAAAIADAFLSMVPVRSRDRPRGSVRSFRTRHAVFFASHDQGLKHRSRENMEPTEPGRNPRNAGANLSPWCLTATSKISPHFL